MKYHKPDGKTKLLSFSNSTPRTFFNQQLETYFTLLHYSIWIFPLVYLANELGGETKNKNPKPLDQLRKFPDDDELVALFPTATQSNLQHFKQKTHTLKPTLKNPTLKHHVHQHMHHLKTKVRWF